MRKVQAADRGCGHHGEGLCEGDPSVCLCIQQSPHGPLLGVVRLGGIAGGWTDALEGKNDETSAPHCCTSCNTLLA